MKDLQKIKAIGEQMLALSIELLRLLDTDEQERAALIERVKKTPPARLFSFRERWRRIETRKKAQA